jgi:hypothetical protein
MFPTYLRRAKTSYGRTPDDDGPVDVGLRAAEPRNADGMNVDQVDSGDRGIGGTPVTTSDAKGSW